MAVSGRAGLFTIDPRFDTDLRSDVHTASKRQKSGAIRLEFGQVTVPAMSSTVVTAKCTVNTGIMALATWGKVPTVTGAISAQNVGSFTLAASSFLSGTLSIDVIATGQFSGQLSGMPVNYMVVGY